MMTTRSDTVEGWYDMTSLDMLRIRYGGDGNPRSLGVRDSLGKYRYKKLLDVI